MKRTAVLFFLLYFSLVSCQSQAPASPSPIQTETALGFGSPCPAEFTDLAELEGRNLQVNVVADGSYCLMDIATQVTYSVSRSNENQLRYIGYEVDMHGLTVQSDYAIKVAQKGKLSEAFSNFESTVYDIVSDKTFEKIYPTVTDLEFLGEWEIFRQNVISHFSDIISIPSWMEYTEFNGYFTPSIACWVSHAYKDSVKIAEEFAYCQTNNGYGFINVSTYMFLEGDQPEISALIAVLPENGDTPTILTPGQVQDDLKFVGCFPVEGSISVDPLWVDDGKDRQYFFHYLNVAYSGVGFSNMDYPVSPVGVVFEYKGITYGDVIPARATVEFVSWFNHGYNLYKFILPDSCLE